MVSSIVTAVGQNPLFSTRRQGIGSTTKIEGFHKRA